jgi:acyl-CoA dehydrogenase family member 9
MSSETEQEAPSNISPIESVVGGFFYGEINESSVFPFPHLNSEQQELAKEMTQAIARFGAQAIDGEKMDRTSEIPDEVRQGFAELGLYGMGVDEDFGGLGLDYTLYSRVFAEVAAHDGSCATLLGAHQSIGYRALINEGTAEQKAKWLPKLASGEVIAAFCLTEPGSGSDAYSIKTKAVQNSDGSFTLTGQKLWITNAGTAGFYTVFAKTDHEIEGKKQEKISCFIVEGGSEGLSFGEKEDKMGIRASETRAVYFDKVHIPKDNVLGELGKGFKIAMNVLNSGRLSLGAGCVGGMKTMLAMASKHAENRKQFDKSIAEFGLIQDKLARMAARIYALESLVYLSTGNMVKGMKDYHLETAVCKVYGSETLWNVVDMAMQIAAGNGYMREYPYERIMRDARINMIFEGTNEILRCFIALSGVRGPSEELKELGKIADVSQALQDPIKSLGVLTNFAKKRISRVLPSRTLTKVHPSLEMHTSHFNRMLADFSIQVENTLIKYGKKIIDHELPQGRLANMSINLYAMVAVLSRTTAILENEKISEDKKSYVQSLALIALDEARHEFMANYKDMDKNIDKHIVEASKHVISSEGYGLDIIDF